MKLEDFETDHNESGNDSKYGKHERTEGSGQVLLVTGIFVSLFFLTVLGVVLIANNDKLVRNQGRNEGISETRNEEPLSEEFEKGSLVSQDLDIWDEFPKTSEQEIQSESSSQKEEKEDETMGGTKTKVTLRDGREEWVTINQYLPKNPYDNAGFSLGNGRLTYYIDGNQVSFTGIDLSKNNNYVDFNDVRKDGIDYVMLRMGYRGYSTGQVTADEDFYDNLKRATDAGLKVGVIFYSQAVTIEEAKEEAAFVIEGLADYEIQYPVAFEMEFISNDNSRIDRLSKEEKTRIAGAFLEDIENAGYVGVIYGDKEWIMVEISYAALSNYGLWLKMESELPDFPYRFHMWRYANAGKVDGVTGTVPISISMIDYSVK